MRRIKIGLFISLLVLQFYTHVLAADPLLKVVTEEFPPYNYTVDGKIAGIATTVVKETLKRSGINYSLRVYPWKRAYEANALKKKNVLIYSIYKSAEREPLFAAWIGPILPPAAVHFYKLKTRADIQVESLEDAKRYSIGVTRSDYSHELLRKMKFPRLEVTSNALSNAQKFLAGRIDLMPTYELTLAARLQQLNTPFRVVEKTVPLIPLADSKTFMAVSRGTDPALIAKLKAAFGQIKAEGIAENALQTYLQSVK